MEFIVSSGLTGLWGIESPCVKGPVSGPLTQGDSIPHNPVRPEETMNSIFRVYKYPYTYSAFNGRTLTPGNFVELYPTSVGSIDNKLNIINCFPNPFTNKINLQNTTGNESYELSNALGQKIWSGFQIEKQDFSYLTNGVYFLKASIKDSSKTIKLIKK